MFHFGPWSETDSDCCQHIRNDGNIYEMIQVVWLDTTKEDKEKGLHEYCVVRSSIDLDDYSKEEMEGYISSYDYTLNKLREDYGDDMWSIIAECILEEASMCDACIVDDADSWEEAKKIVEEIIQEQ